MSGQQHTGWKHKELLNMSRENYASRVQLAWGIALALMGVAMFFRIPQVMPRIAEIAHFQSALGLVRFCFYFIAFLLVFGGMKKITTQIHEMKSNQEQ